MTYFMVTTTVSDQKIRDMTPSRLAGVRDMAWGPWKHSLTVYRGLVPMSPYTTPKAPIDKARVLFRSLLSEGVWPEFPMGAGLEVD